MSMLAGTMLVKIKGFREMTHSNAAGRRTGSGDRATALAGRAYTPSYRPAVNLENSTELAETVFTRLRLSLSDFARTSSGMCGYQDAAGAWLRFVAMQMHLAGFGQYI